MKYVSEYKLLPLLLIKHVTNRFVFIMSEHQVKREMYKVENAFVKYS